MEWVGDDLKIITFGIAGGIFTYLLCMCYFVVTFLQTLPLHGSWLKNTEFKLFVRLFFHPIFPSTPLFSLSFLSPSPLFPFTFQQQWVWSTRVQGGGGFYFLSFPSFPPLSLICNVQCQKGCPIGRPTFFFVLFFFFPFFLFVFNWYRHEQKGFRESGGGEGGGGRRRKKIHCPS